MSFDSDSRNLRIDMVRSAEYTHDKGIKNLFDIYLPIVDAALIFDNSEGKHELLADNQIDGLLNIINQEKFDYLKNYHDNQGNTN